MKELLTWEQMLFTERQNFAAFKSYRILKFGKLVRSLKAIGGGQGQKIHVDLI